MNFVQQAMSYLLTADNWTGPVGLAARIVGASGVHRGGGGRRRR